MILRRVLQHKTFLKFARQSLWLFGGMGIAQIAGLVELAVLVRTLSVVAFGQLTLIIAYVTTVNAFIDFRVWEGIIKFFNEYLMEQRSDKALAVLRLCVFIDGGTGVMALLVLIATSKLAAIHLLDDVSMAREITLYGVMLLLISLDTTFNGLLRVYERFDILGFKDGVSHSLRSVLSIIAVLWFGTLHAVILAIVLAGALQTIIFGGITLYLTRRKLGGLTTSTSLDSDERRRIISFIFGTNVLGTLKLLSENLDVLVLGFIGGPAVSGIYKVAVSAVHLHYKLKLPITMLGYPEIVRARQKGIKQLRSTIATLTTLSGLIAISSAVIFFVFAEQIIELISQKSAYLVAADYLRIMLLGNVIDSLLFWTGLLLMAHERVWIVNRIHFVISGITPLLMFILIPPFKGWGASWIFVFRQIAVNIASLFAIWQYGYLPIERFAAGSPYLRVQPAPAESETHLPD